MPAILLHAQDTTYAEENPVAMQHGWTQECEQRVKAAQDQPVDVLFIGDSITQNFIEGPTPGWDLVGRSVLDQHYAHWNALDFGVGSDGTEHILWRMQHMKIQKFHPRIVVILAGINDAQYSPKDIAAGVAAIVHKTHSMYPTAKIVLMDILPSSREKAKMDAANTMIEKLAENRTIFSLNLAPEMPAVGDSWLGVGRDHVHLTKHGDEIWADDLDPLLDNSWGLKLPSSDFPGCGDASHGRRMRRDCVKTATA